MRHVEDADRAGLALSRVWKPMSLAAALAVALGAGGAAHAQEPAEPPAQNETAPAETSSKLSFHAYLNQAYARSDSHQVFGIPEDGTANYNNIAFQFRYQLTHKDVVVVQLAHDRLGKSTLNDVIDDIELDWAFYQRQITDVTSIKVGQIQLPLGIYNEIQDVGTLLPFYAAPESVYLKNRTSESFVGAMVSHTFAQGSPWSVDGDLYYGGWDRLEQTPQTGVTNVAKAENAVGTQLWLNTPASGVRFGLAAFRMDIRDSVNQVGSKDRSKTFVLSYDGTFERFFTRAEYIYGRQPARLTSQITTPRIDYEGYYGQVGVTVLPRLKVSAQAEVAQYDLNLGTGKTTIFKDYALGIAYYFDYNIVAKLEAHRNRGTQVENEALPGPVVTNYGLASLAISF
jgi:hypothetical protein